MASRLNLHYDREGDILYLTVRPPYPEQETEELEDEILVRLNPSTREVEGLEILFFSTRFTGPGGFDLPVEAEIRLSV